MLDARQGKALNDKIDSTKSSLQTSFQAGVDGIYNAIVAQGTTPASKSQGDVKNAIGTLATAKYNQGKSDVTLSASASGRTVTATASNGKTASASVAYAGTNGTVSVSTSGGSGNQSFDITDGWCTSINVDRTGAYNKGVTDADNRANPNSTNYKSGYNAGAAAQSPIYIPALRWYMSGATQFIFNIGSPRRTYFYIGRVDNSLGLGATSGWEYLHIYLDDTTVLNALDYQGKQINISGYSTLRIEAKTTTQISNAAIVDIRIT